MYHAQKKKELLSPKGFLKLDLESKKAKDNRRRMRVRDVPSSGGTHESGIAQVTGSEYSNYPKISGALPKEKQSLENRTAESDNPFGKRGENSADSTTANAIAELYANYSQKSMQSDEQRRDVRKRKQERAHSQADHASVEPRRTSQEPRVAEKGNFAYHRGGKDASRGKRHEMNTNEFSTDGGGVSRANAANNLINVVKSGGTQKNLGSALAPYSSAHEKNYYMPHTGQVFYNYGSRAKGDK